MLVTAKTSSNHYHLDNWIFIRQYRYKQEIRESVHISFYSRRPHSFTKKYNKINLHYFVDKMKWILFLFTNGLQSNRCVFSCKMKCIITMIDFFLQKKCEQYWPRDINESLFYGDIVVHMESESHLPDFILRTFVLRLVRFS